MSERSELPLVVRHTLARLQAGRGAGGGTIMTIRRGGPRRGDCRRPEPPEGGEG